MSDRSWLDTLWYGTSGSTHVARNVLWPAEQSFRFAVAMRNLAFDRGFLGSVAPPLVTISVGNLSVGGTGKTPFSSYLAEECARRGAHPAIVLRGYGEDEELVHGVLTPEVPVFVGADRLISLTKAVAAGCSMAILDDGFQHRRVRRDLDVVLYSADRVATRCLPAGPLREPLSRLTRADLVVVTNKSATRAQLRHAVSQVASVSRTSPLVADLTPGDLRPWPEGPSRPLSALKGARVLLISGVGDPAAFRGQMESLGAVVTAHVLRDHHRFTAADGLRLAEQGRPFDMIVCTLKDAVKLGAVWPRGAGGFYYVSQRVVVTEGASELDSRLDHLVRAINLRPATGSRLT